jgi:hypothetical protein
MRFFYPTNIKKIHEKKHAIKVIFSQFALTSLAH